MGYKLDPNKLIIIKNQCEFDKVIKIEIGTIINSWEALSQNFQCFHALEYLQCSLVQRYQTLMMAVNSHSE